MKKQEFYDHQKPRKLMDQVSDVMRLKHYAFRGQLGTSIGLLVYKQLNV